MSQNSAKDLLGPNIVSQEKLGRVSRNIDYEDNVKVFYSSGGSKQIGFTPQDLDVLRSGFEQTFREAGMIPEDVAVNWGAPEGTPHMSRWCFDNGTYFIDEVVNNSVADSFDDYRDRWDEVTVLQSMPRMLKSIGQQIEDEYGELKNEFPNLKMSLTAGDVMSESLRDWIETKYGLDVVNFYAGTEFGAAATEVEPGVYEPTNPNLTLEILDEDTEVGENGEVSETDVYNIQDLNPKQQVTGPILFSVSHREALPFTRYRGGDIWTVWGAENGPRMSFEGREDNVILYSGANLYPEEIDDAVRNLADQDWKLVVAEKDDAVSLDFYLPEKYVDETDLADSIAEQNDTFNVWRDTGSGTATEINSQTFESWKNLEKLLEEKYELPRDDQGNIDLINDLNGNNLKRKRIGFDQSYFANNSSSR
jgi:phenylacetate-coenzyme A ligase PaaK-like adenylate-forming protein